MAAEREPTPEKQLLNLIEEPKLSSIQQAAIKRGGFSLFSLGAFKGRFSFFEKNIKSLLSLKREPSDIKRINRLLRFCVFILVVYFVTSFIISTLNLEKEPVLVLKTEVSEQAEIAKLSSPLKKLSYYLEEVRTRDIFNPLPKIIEADGVGGRKRKVSAKIAEAAKDLKLTGISWSDDPDVFIEDIKSKRVYFLKKGEMIGKIKIEAIFRDKVVLSYEGEELTLR